MEDSKWAVLLGILLLFAVGEVRSQENCINRAQACFQTWNQNTQQGTAAVAVVCRETETFAACALNGLQSAPCNVFMEVDLLDNLNGVVSYIQDPQGPYNCTLQIASNARLQLDACKRNVLDCQRLIPKQATATSVQGCRSFDHFAGCTVEHLQTVCSANIKAAVAELVQVEGQRFEVFPYFCTGLRNGSDIDGANSFFARCVDTLLANTQTLPSDRVCSEYELAKACLNNSKSNAYPPQAVDFDRMFVQRTANFTAPPNNCVSILPTTTTTTTTTTTRPPTTTTTHTTTTTTRPPPTPSPVIPPGPPPTSAPPSPPTTPLPTTTTTTTRPPTTTTTFAPPTTTAMIPSGSVGGLPQELASRLQALLREHTLASWTFVGEGRGNNVIVVLTLVNNAPVFTGSG